MRRQTAVELWGAAFLALLGLAPLAACEEDSEYSPGEGDAGIGDDGDPITTDAGDDAGDLAGNNGNNGVGSPFPCNDPQPLLVAGQDTGFDRCDKGFLRRRAITVCPTELPRMSACEAGEGEFSNCATDADCAERPNGYCQSGSFEPGCFCNYGCTQDSDCAPNQICLCGAPVGQCVQADCASDADCDGDLLCSSYITEPGCGGLAFSCQTLADGCGGDGDCGDGAQCSSDGQAHICRDINCAIGRPFLVHGEARLAQTAARADWSDRAPALASDDLDPALRAHLGEVWTQVGLMEHASVAAFARFALQLLSLGAPPSLLALTHKAMADETEHARLAFSLASSYMSRHIGPGPLSMEGALEDLSLREILAMLIREGCVGETVAALEATEALAQATDPAVRAALARICEDERDHARLAWETIRWALSTGDAGLAAFVEGEFEAALAELPAPEDDDPRWSARELLGHGVVAPSIRDALRRDAVSAVLRPCLRGVLAQHREAVAA